jgi:aminoglycoside phosphotransferase (APT) family kinase protein
MRTFMAYGPARDEHELASGFAAWWKAREQESDVTVTLAHATAGFSNETLVATVVAAGERRRVVLRLPPVAPAYPVYDLHAQELVQNVLHDSRFPAPRVLAVEDDETWIGSPFLVMEFAPGRIAGQAPGLDPWLTTSPMERQRRVQQGFLDSLADLHAIDWRRTALTGQLRTGLEAELQHWTDYVLWASDGAPAEALLDALAWCRATVPRPEAQSVLLWGDARLGNMVFDDEGDVVAVLDWELATLGPPEMDLAWFLALEELTAKATGARVPGFEDRDSLLARYELRSGHTPVGLPWHEIFALVRSIAINDKLARLVTAAGGDAPGGFGDDNLMLPYVTRRIERFESAGRSG